MEKNQSDEENNKEEVKEELIKDEELRRVETTLELEEKNEIEEDVTASPIAKAIKTTTASSSSGDLILSPDIQEVTNELSTDTIPYTDTMRMRTTIGIKSITSSGSIGLIDSKENEEEDYEEDAKEVSHGNHKKSSSDEEWEWMQEVQCLKIENRLQLIQSVSTHVAEREYLVYIWDNKDQSGRVRRDLENLVLHVKEKSSYWQRQFFGSWRSFELSFTPSRWDMKKMKITRDPRSILTCTAPSNTDMYPREYEIRNISTSVRRNRLGNVTAVLRRYGHVIRVLRGGRYVFDVYNSLGRNANAEFVFESRRMCCQCCRVEENEKKTRGLMTRDCGFCSRIGSCLAQCVAKSTCHVCKLPASRCYVVRENNVLVRSTSRNVRGPIVADLKQVRGDFILRFRDRLSSFSSLDLLRKKRLIFAASFYVELMSYQVGELININHDHDRAKEK